MEEKVIMRKFKEKRCCDEPERATPLLSFGQVHAVIHPLAVLSNILNEPQTDTDHHPTGLRCRTALQEQARELHKWRVDQPNRHHLHVVKK